MTDVIVTQRHLRACRYCAKGCRAWFARHGLNWGDFVKNGLPASVLLATGDHLAARPVALAREEAAHGG